MLCGSKNRDAAFCARCRSELPWLSTSRCPVCALPTHGSQTCGECLKAPPAFDRTFAPFSYRFPVDSLVHALKYDRRLELARAFGAELAASLARAPLPDVVIPVPLSRRRFLERGFNQAHEIAKRLRHPVRVDACVRVKETPPQALLPWKLREKNIRGAFECKIDLTGLHVGLVDDVITTGATMNELAKIVKEAGAREVSCWAVARTLKSSEL